MVSSEESGEREIERATSQRCFRTMALRLLPGVVPLLLLLISMTTLDGVGAQEGMAVLHNGAFNHQLALVSTDGSQEQLAVTDEDVLYLGITVDQSECPPYYCVYTVLFVRVL